MISELCFALSAMHIVSVKPFTSLVTVFTQKNFGALYKTLVIHTASTAI